MDLGNAPSVVEFSLSNGHEQKEFRKDFGAVVQISEITYPSRSACRWLQACFTPGKESQDGADYRNPSNNHLQRKQYQGAYAGFCFPKMGSSDNATMKDFAGVHYGKTEGNVLIRLWGE
jgi:hypothetical protein